LKQNFKQQHNLTKQHGIVTLRTWWFDIKQELNGKR